MGMTNIKIRPIVAGHAPLIVIDSVMHL